MNCNTCIFIETIETFLKYRINYLTNRYIKIKRIETILSNELYTQQNQSTSYFTNFIDLPYLSYLASLINFNLRIKLKT